MSLNLYNFYLILNIIATLNILKNLLSKKYKIKNFREFKIIIS